MILITCSERLLDGKQLKKNDTVLHSSFDLANKTVKVFFFFRKIFKQILNFFKQVHPCIVSNPSEGNLRKHADQIQVISMIGEIIKNTKK